MFDFGDELLIGGHRIPWLIWIQLVVMLLLIILLYYFSIFALGLDPSPNAATPSSSADLHCEISGLRPSPKAVAVAAVASSRRLHTAKLQASESHNIQGDAGTSTSRRRLRREEIQEREGSSSAKDGTSVSAFDEYHHPCHFFGLASQALLKCLGLDPPSIDPSNSKQKKR